MNKVTRLYLFFFCSLCLSLLFSASQTVSASILESGKTKFDFTVLNSIGEPQTEAFIKVRGFNQTYRPDSTGHIVFFQDLPQSYTRMAGLYLNTNEDHPVRSFPLSEVKTEFCVYVNTKEDVLRFKQENKSVTIEGMVHDDRGEPLPFVSVSIQGTGRRTLTDEIGLFQIEADYNHPIIIRASGMETKTLNIDYFLRNQEEAFHIELRRKNLHQIYNVVDEMPQYRGGMKEFLRYLQRKAPYPEKLKKQKVEGVVVMQFVVEPDGSITHPRLVRPLHPLLDTLAFRAVREMPRWIAGRDGGMPVRCRYSTPIQFKVPKPQPIRQYDRQQFVRDSIMADSLKRHHLLLDSLRADSTLRAFKDSLRADSLRLMQHRQDSLRMDSLRLAQESMHVKKHHNAFVRFFRWLFGIERRARRREAKLMEASGIETEMKQAQPASGPKQDDPALGVDAAKSAAVAPKKKMKGSKQKNELIPEDAIPEIKPEVMQAVEKQQLPLDQPKSKKTKKK